jgi:protein-tyrosine phosphatase
MFNKLLAFCIVAIAAIAHAEVIDLTCDQTAPTEYKLSYTLTAGTHKVTIFATTDPTRSDGMQQVAETADSQAVVHAGKPGERMYFFLKPDQGEQREVSIRRLPLEGTPNFRDLGGYRTTDGRYTQWGKIYRSGVLTYLTPSDMDYLGHLGIRVVCDFRTLQENTDAPEKWIDGASTEHLSLPIGTDSNGKTMAVMQSFMASHPTEAQLREYMTKIYGNFVIGAAPEYAQVFVQLKQDKLPLLYHCTAGKDRTGVFSAVLLLTLGVPEETVLADYHLTDQYLFNPVHRDATSQQATSTMNKTMSSMTPEARRAMSVADPAYLKSTLHLIDEKYGSFANYRRQALGVSDADVEILRARLLSK